MKDEEAGEEEIVSLMSGNSAHVRGESSATVPSANGSTARNRSPSPNARPRHPRRRPMSQIQMQTAQRDEGLQSPLMLRLTCLSVLTLVVLGGMGLLTYVQDKKAPTFEFIPASGAGDAEQEMVSGETMGNYVSGKNTPPSRTSTGSGNQVSGMLDKEALQQLMDEAGVVETHRTPQKVYYDPQWTQYNPFYFEHSAQGPSPLGPLLSGLRSDKPTTPALGYMQMPHIVQNHLVFCSQGDVFLTTIDPEEWQKQAAKNARTWGQYPTSLPAAKLTTTVGNVLDPKLHPSLRYLAYTATYAGRRDLYILDLKGGSAAVRLTYWDASVGVNGLIGWWGESALVFRALSNEVGLPDYRLYVLHLEDEDDGTLVPRNHTNRRIRRLEESADASEEVKAAEDDPPKAPASKHNTPPSMLQIDPIPLTQARDAARSGDCWYFVRYAQSSHTVRYVGGTAEQLYRYCDGASHADRLLYKDLYKGTSKAPQLYSDSDYLFFLSDRGRKHDGSWQPDRMNVWALRLSDNLQDHSGDRLIQITDTSCDFEGRVIQEYSIDRTTGHIVVRIGADLYWMTADTIQEKLASGNRRKLDINKLYESTDSINENTTLTDAFENEIIGTEVEDEEELDLDDPGNETAINETVSRVYYNYDTPILKSRFVEDMRDHVTGSSTELTRLPVVVHSDFHTHQERLIPVDMLDHLKSADVYETSVGSLQFIMTLRGQLWVAAVEEDSEDRYEGSGRNMPGRRYRLAPGVNMGGLIRILAVRHVPNPAEDDSSDRRLAVILATDPLSATAEHAFYLIETQSSAMPLFLDLNQLPKPFLGGHLSGGSAKEGGLGSVEADSVTISTCGRRMAWTDRDGRILVMNLPQYQNMTSREAARMVVLPQENEQGQPMVGEEVDLVFSPGGRYLAVEHHARNQFFVITIVDLGDPQGDAQVADIKVRRIVQATPPRFNSVSPYWGKSTADMYAYDRESNMASMLGEQPPEDVATTLFFLSDRDISSDVNSPWGTRQPMPHFTDKKALYALPLFAYNSTSDGEGPFGGGGASELKVDAILARKQSIKAILSAASSRRQLLQRSLVGAFGLADDAFARYDEKGGRRHLDGTENLGTEAPSPDEDDKLRTALFPKDMDIDLGPRKDPNFTFARYAYRLATIPEANYIVIVGQTADDGSFVLIQRDSGKAILTAYLAEQYPSGHYASKIFAPASRKLSAFGRSTCGKYLYFGFAPDGQFRIVPNSGQGISQMLLDVELDDYIVSASGSHLSVWPAMEYRQLYDDAWRMLRDYFYDAEMTGIDWPGVHERYLPLVSRCAKREELDDVLVQMASELSALHVLVYGGEYDSPSCGDKAWAKANSVASLGATFKRVPDWKGYEITSIAESDPDFSAIDGGNGIYSPLSGKTLRLSGQRGLEAGDVIVGVDGESVMDVPDIHMFLRGKAGESVRLNVLRLASGEKSVTNADAVVEPVIAVPIRSSEADDLRYFAWEWKTRQLAEKLAKENGFSVGYVHLQDMSGPEAENSFARGFFPNYHKDAMILDVRHNRGGNIDSWILDVLQRKSWMYWQSRDFNPENGGLGWDEQFAFRGHIIVLVDEKTSSDGEGVSRGISELGLGRLIGTRTWGGGIWLASDNHLVDGGIATAPEIGTYNENFGWGLGIEQMGVEPDVEVDNDPHQAYGGKDSQLETAISELKKWLEVEPIILPQPPQKKQDMSIGDRECKLSS